MAQPSLSQQIRLLEQRIGTRLFERAPTGMIPTPAGQALAAAAQTWLSAAGSLHGTRQPVRVGVPRGVDAVVMAAIHERLGDEVVLVKCRSSAAASWVRGRQLDAAIVREPLAENLSGLEVTHMLDRPLGVLGSSADVASLPRTPEGSVPIADLAGRSLAWFDEDRAPGYARAVLDELHAAGWGPGLVRLDPASATMTEDILARRRDLVMLRPQPSRMAPGLAWALLTPTIMERLDLLQRH